MAMVVEESKRDCETITGLRPDLIDWEFEANPHRDCDSMVRCPLGVDHEMGVVCIRTEGSYGN